MSGRMWVPAAVAGIVSAVIPVAAGGAAAVLAIAGLVLGTAALTLPRAVAPGAPWVLTAGLGAVGAGAALAGASPAVLAAQGVLLLVAADRAFAALDPVDGDRAGLEPLATLVLIGAAAGGLCAAAAGAGSPGVPLSALLAAVCGALALVVLVRAVRDGRKTR
jgi:uncharacterized membrane protein YeaQ/YmgE (transglycosylase-associated protein family)